MGELLSVAVSSSRVSTNSGTPSTGTRRLPFHEKRTRRD